VALVFLVVWIEPALDRVGGEGGDHGRDRLRFIAGVEG
jgi:hypothetical protein